MRGRGAGFSQADTLGLAQAICAVLENLRRGLDHLGHAIGGSGPVTRVQAADEAGVVVHEGFADIEQQIRPSAAGAEDGHGAGGIGDVVAIALPAPAAGGVGGGTAESPGEQVKITAIRGQRVAEGLARLWSQCVC
jgi:hypothetical protein